MKYKTVHIGAEIEAMVNSRNLSHSEFGRLIGVPKQNVKRIFEKESIDTDRLKAISKALDFDFFVYYQVEKENEMVSATQGGKAILNKGFMFHSGNDGVTDTKSFAKESEGKTTDDSNVLKDTIFRLQQELLEARAEIIQLMKGGKSNR